MTEVILKFAGRTFKLIPLRSGALKMPTKEHGDQFFSNMDEAAQWLDLMVKSGARPEPREG